MRSKLETTDDIPSIVVGDLYRRGLPVAASPVVRRKSVGRERVVLELTPLQDRVDCVFRWNGPDGEQQEIESRVRVSWQPANLGGLRASLHCSSVGCGRRARRLFLSNAYLVCRRCANVRYPSQIAAQPRRVKNVARAKAIRARLGGTPELGAPLPSRPKGMHLKTYESLLAELAEIEREEEQQEILAGELSFLDLVARRLQESMVAARRPQE
jgi:hypothetical protein